MARQEYMKCPKCGHAVAIPQRKRKGTERRLKGLPGYWVAARYNEVTKGDEVVMVLGFGRAAETVRGIIVRKYRGISMRTIEKNARRRRIDQADVEGATTMHKRVRDA